MADKVIAYLSCRSRVRQTRRIVGPCKSCDNDDCFAIAEPWVATSIYLDGKAYITGGLCSAHHVGWATIGDCAHLMVENDYE
jgi:hypothetical protein